MQTTAPLLVCISTKVHYRSRVRKLPTTLRGNISAFLILTKLHVAVVSMCGMQIASGMERVRFTRVKNRDLHIVYYALVKTYTTVPPRSGTVVCILTEGHIRGCIWKVNNSLRGCV